MVVLLPTCPSANMQPAVLKSCPTCSSSSRIGHVELVQLNLEEAMWMCTDSTCTYPFDSERMREMIVQRNYKYISKRKHQGRTGSSASSIVSRTSSKSRRSIVLQSSGATVESNVSIRQNAAGFSTVTLQEPVGYVSSYPGNADNKMKSERKCGEQQSCSDDSASLQSISSSLSRESCITPSWCDSDSTPVSEEFCSAVDGAFLDGMPELADILDAAQDSSSENTNLSILASKATESDAQSLLDELSDILGPKTAANHSGKLTSLTEELLDVPSSDSSYSEAVEWSEVTNNTNVLPHSSRPSQSALNNVSWNKFIERGCKMILILYGSAPVTNFSQLTSVRGHWELSCGHCLYSHKEPSALQCPFEVISVTSDFNVMCPVTSRVCLKCREFATAKLVWDTKPPAVICYTTPEGLTETALAAHLRSEHVYRLALVVELTVDEQLMAWVVQPASECGSRSL